MLAIQFADLLEALEATPAILAHRPSAVEVMDRFILDNTQAERGARPAAADVHRGRSGGAALRRVLRRSRRGPAAAARRARSAISRRAGFGYRYHRAHRRRRRRRAIWTRARSGARPVDGDEGRREVAVLRRGHGGRAGAAARLHRAVPRDRPQPRHDGRRLRARVGRLPARAAGRQPEDRGGRAHSSRRSPRDSADLVLEFGGALSGEHGDGLVRSPFMEKMFGPVLYDAFRQIKRTFDPDGIFNPGQDRRCAAARPRTCATAPRYRTPQPRHVLRLLGATAAWAAPSRCAAASARAARRSTARCARRTWRRARRRTRRAGAPTSLRLAMAGRLGEAGLGDEGVREVLDLCLECRACKAECPVGVDVARFKSEFLADYWRRHGTPLRARVARPRPRAVALGQPARAAVELRSRGARRRAGSTSGCSASIAGACRRPGRRRRSRGGSPASAARAAGRAGRRSSLFNDTFTNYYNPGDRHGGLDVLEAAGYGVDAGAERLLRPAADLAGAARRGARRRRATNTDASVSARRARAADRVLRAELPVGDARGRAGAAARRRAAAGARGRRARRCSFEEFARSGVRRPDARASTLRAGPPRILLHGHCHQKAMGLLRAGEGAARAAFPAPTVVDLDAGCCGMAGSFGYAREHFDVSRAIGERRLLPAARSLAPATVLVASGVSCRHQVADFTGARARCTPPSSLQFALAEPA